MEASNTNVDWQTDPAAPEQPAAAAPAPEQPAAAAPAPEQPAAAAPAPEQPAAPAEPEPAGLVDQIEQLRRDLAELEKRTTSGQLVAGQPDDELVKKVAQLREDFADWPRERDDRPQPWDLKAHGLPQPGVTRDHLPGGQPDELSPVVPAHNKPLLTTGMAGDPVRELAELLGVLGYPTSVSEGKNGVGAFDDTVRGAVEQFKRDYGVKEDPSQFRTEEEAARFVGPWVWEGLLRAVKFVRKELHV